MKIVFQYYFLAVVLLCHGVCAQCVPPPARSWIRVSDASGFVVDTLWFGFDSTATYGCDPQLCEFERTIPPISTCDFMPVFVNIPGREGWDCPQGLGIGVMQDYRHYSNRAQVDTHRVFFGTRLPECYPLAIRWSAQSILAICDSARLIDEFAGVYANVRMNDVESLLVANNSLQSLLLFRYGARQLITAVGQVGDLTPLRLWVAQNYPNPFNPSTSISFSIPHSTFVTLTVFNALGQEITSLVSAELDAGTYSTEWNAGGIPSGVYFYTLRAGDVLAAKKLVLIR